MSNTPLEQVTEIEKAILLYFAEDALSGLMYAAMPQFEKKELRKLFIAMQHLCMILHVQLPKRLPDIVTSCLTAIGNDAARDLAQEATR